MPRRRLDIKTLAREGYVAAQEIRTVSAYISLVASYTSSTNDTPFISYFSSTTPDSESKRIRLKTILFLQGSMLYDPVTVKTRLNDHAKILKLELAILEGKVCVLA